MKRLIILLFIALIGLALGKKESAAATAEASPQVYLWGIDQDCAKSPQRTEAVRRYLRSIGYAVTVISPASDWPPCQGQTCAQLLDSHCPGPRVGVAIGGRVEERNRVIRVRLWLYDYAAQRTAYQDGFCDHCELDESLTLSSGEIIERPSFEPAPGPTPIYCDPSSLPSDQPQPAHKIYYLARGESRYHLSYQLLLEDVLRKSGIKSELAQLSSRVVTQEALNRIASRDSAARVLWTDSPSDGRVVVWIFDQPSQVMDSIPIDCPGCDRELLLKKVRGAAENLVDRCLGMHCTAGQSPLRRPPEACLPYASCGEGSDGAIPTGSTASRSSPPIDRGLRRGIQGALWGMVAIGAVTTVALLAANYSGAGSTLDASGVRISRNLGPAAAVAGGATALMLGAAIPISIALGREPSRPTASRGFLCPN